MYQYIDERYQIVRSLGGGGMAEVYLAHDELLDRDVAIKVLRSQYASDKEFVERFRREAKSAASLSHPNIVSIHDRGETEDGTYYIVMEYVPGGTLKEHVLRKGPLAPDTSIEVATQIAEALKVAHEKGVIHRDIKPQNILITDSGDVKVGDFGIARATSAAALTQTGHVLGSVHYMSPEQAMGTHVDPRSDLYSLGVVLYEMLTGERPFNAEAPMGVVMKHVDGHPRSPKEVNSRVPEEISAVTTKLLAKNPADRYPSAAELIKEFERVKEGWRPSSATTSVLKHSAGPRGPRSEKPTKETKRYKEPTPPVPTKKEGVFWNLRKRIRQAVIRLVAAAMLLAGLVLVGVTALDQWPVLLEDLGLRDQSQNAQNQTYTVPDLRDRTVDEAQSMTWPRFNVAVRSVENSSRPQGTIIRQDPSPSKQALAGSTISVVVSSGSSSSANINEDIERWLDDLLDQIDRQLDGP